MDKGSYAAIFKAVSLEDAGTGSDGAAGWQGETGTVFAVKILLTSMTSEDFVRNFRREALLLGRVDHPGIIKMHHFGKSPQPFMVTEYCEGGNLWNAVKCEEIKAAKSDGEDSEDLVGVPKDMPLLDIPAIAMDVALALEYLHNAGFAHRDIKSSNVLLTWCPDLGRVRAKMCDFGSAAPISKMPRRPKKNLLGFSGRWQPVGTMLWMAPEMLEPPLEGATPPVGYSGDKVDVYSLGIVLWELMEWRIPWTGANISKQEVIDSVVGRNERLPLPSSCDKRLADVISAMWAASPVDRPDMGSVVRTFEAVGSKWDDAGNFAKVANRAAGEGEALARALSKYNAEQGNPLKEEDVGESRVEEAEAQAAEPEEAPATRAASGTDAADAAVAEEAAAAAAASGPAEPPRNWFGEVGAVDVEEVRAKLVPMLYPHMFASVTSDADTKRLDEQKAELRELQSKAVDLRARSKLDPFAAFTADAKGREAKRLDKTISLAAAESEVHAWRATRDLLREQLAEAEKQHLDWRRKYREIERKR